MLLPRLVAYRRVAPTLARRDCGRRLAPLEGHVGLVYDGRVGEVGGLERRASARGFTVGVISSRSRVSGWIGFVYIFLSVSSGLCLHVAVESTTPILRCHIVIDAYLPNIFIAHSLSHLLHSYVAA